MVTGRGIKETYCWIVEKLDWSTIHMIFFDDFFKLPKLVLEKSLQKPRLPCSLERNSVRRIQIILLKCQSRNLDQTMIYTKFLMNLNLPNFDLKEPKEPNVTKTSKFLILISKIYRKTLIVADFCFGFFHEFFSMLK